MEAKRFTESEKKIINKDTIYYISEQIGKGGFSNVFNLICTEKNKKYCYNSRCIKIFKTSHRYSQTAEKESNLLNKLKDYNYFINLIETFVYMEHHCLILKRYDMNLFKYYSRYNVKHYNLDFIIKQLLNGLCVLKQNKIIHSDLKPENILISLDNDVVRECVICDFNSAIDVNNDIIDQYNNQIVTCWYRAPEIYLNNVEYSYEIDMWSFGVVLYELITKKPLFYIKIFKRDRYENERLFNLHYALLGNSPLFAYEPTEIKDVKVDASLFQSGYQTLFTETIKWDPKKRFTPQMALEYLEKNELFIKKNIEQNL